MGIVTWLIVGLIAGVVARAVVPGRDPMGWLATLALGLVGSLVGGLIGSMMQGDMEIGPVGLIGSIVGAIIALLVWRAMNRRHGMNRRHTAI